MTKAKDTFTVSDVQPPQMVQIVKESDPPGFPDSNWVPEPDADHWLKLGWKLARR